MSGTERVRVVVAVTTYLRPDDLRELLPVLGSQADAARTEYDVEIVVVDNDTGISRRDRRRRRRGIGALRCEPQAGIAAARNRALAEADGADVLVFIDDDERPSDRWLVGLLGTWRRTGAQAVAGPVVTEAPTNLDPSISRRPGPSSPGRSGDRHRAGQRGHQQLAARPQRVAPHRPALRRHVRVERWRGHPVHPFLRRRRRSHRLGLRGVGNRKDPSRPPRASGACAGP